MGRGGGGGGFGGFPYRSSHQQGSDGAGRGRGGGRRRPRRKQSTKRHKNGPLLFGADVFVPFEQRGCLMGRGGRVVRNLTRTTGAHIHVPPKQRQPPAPNHSAVAANADNEEEEENDDDRPVYVKSATISSLLHALWRIAGILSTTARGDEDDQSASENDNNNNVKHLLECRVRLPNVTSPIPGHLTLQRQQGGDGSTSSSALAPAAFLGLQNGISAYCIEVTCAAAASCTASSVTTTTTIREPLQVVHTLVDNERFAHPDWTAAYTVVVEDEQADAHNEEPSSSTTLVFVYGDASQHPEQLCQNLKGSIQELLLSSLETGDDDDKE